MPGADGIQEAEGGTPQSLMSHGERDSQIRAAIADMEKASPTPAAPPATPSPSAKAPADAKPPAGQPPKQDGAPAAKADGTPAPAGEKKDEKNWSKLVEEDRRQVAKRKDQDARDRQLADRETKIKQAEDAQQLLQTNPLEYAKRYGGADFAKKFVAASLNGGAETPEDIAKRTVSDEVSKLRQELAMKDAQIELANYRSGIATAATKHEEPVLSAFYDDEELRNVGQGVAARAYQEREKMLTPDEVVGTLHEELVDRLTRVAKHPAGQKLLRKLLGDLESPEPPKQDDKAAASGPTTMTRNLHASSPPPAGAARAHTRLPSENPELLREALRAVQA